MKLTPRTHGTFRMDAAGSVFDQYEEACGSVEALPDGRWTAFGPRLPSQAAEPIGFYGAPGQAFRALCISLA